MLIQIIIDLNRQLIQNEIVQAKHEYSSSLPPSKSSSFSLGDIFIQFLKKLCRTTIHDCATTRAPSYGAAIDIQDCYKAILVKIAQAI